MLRISSKFCWGYVEALVTVKKEQPDVWYRFCTKVPTFSVAFFSFFIPVQAIVTHIYYSKIICNSKKIYTKFWNEQGHNIIEYLNTIFDMEGNFDITAFVCITPLFIRNINKKFFLIPTNASIDRLEKLLLHEISHFYFYKMTQGLNIDSRLLWKISEFIVPFIIEDYFSAERRKDGYLGIPGLALEMEIYRWIKKEVTFSEFLNKVIEMEKMCGEI